MNLKNNLTIVGILILLFFLLFFGLTGVKLIIGTTLLFILPFYIILNNFPLDKTEKLIFSFFIGIGIFPTLVYYLGILFNSIKIAIIVTFILLLVLGLLLRKLKKR